MSDHKAFELNSAIDRALRTFQEASAPLLHTRALQQRVERKYLLPLVLLEPLLDRLRKDHAAVRSAGRLIATYDTLYFDTSERQMYHDHRRGRVPRCKVRVRHHLERGRTFLEIKSKGKSGRTTKARMELPFAQTELDANARRFIDAHCPIRATRLVPCLWITFRRVTLIGVALDERVTLDCELEFRDGRLRKPVSGVVIAEIKQARYSNTNGAVRALRTLNVREQALSKYCLATAGLTEVRMNTFKPLFRALERLIPCQS